MIEKLPYNARFPYIIRANKKHTYQDYCNRLAWLNTCMGKKNEDWTVVFLKYHIYAFKEEKDAMFFMLRFGE